MKARRQFLLRITQMLSVAALLAVFTAQAQVSPATDFQAHVVRERDDPKLEQFFRKYVLSGARWASHSITWYYSPANQPSSFATSDVITLVQTAMERWSQICDMSFVYGGESTANPNTFDRSNVVGWDGAISSSGYTSWWTDASGTMLDADIIFNANDPYITITLPDIATHEVGHMLGLSHSHVQDAVMAGPPLTQYNSDQHTLRPDDVAACRALYGLSCSYSVSPLDLSNMPEGGGLRSIAVTTPDGCPVAATSLQPWVAINTVTSTSGTTTISLQIAANPGAARATSIRIADRLFLVTQAGQ